MNQHRPGTGLRSTGDLWHPETDPSRRAFTLIELIVATILASVLLAALLSATATLSRDRKRLVDQAAAATPSESSAIVRLIRHDLVNARSFRSSPDGRLLQVIGNSGLAASSLAADGRLVEVEYRVRAVGEQSALVRNQRRRDDPAGAVPIAELVALGVTRIEVTGTAADTSSLPPRIRLRLEFRDRVAEEEVWLR